MSTNKPLPQEPPASSSASHWTMLRRKPVAEPAPLSAPGPAVDLTSMAGEIMSPEAAKETLVPGSEEYDISPASSIHEHEAVSPIANTIRTSPLLQWLRPGGGRNDAIPTIPPPQWQGSRDLDELARAREAAYLAQQQGQPQGQTYQQVPAGHVPPAAQTQFQDEISPLPSQPPHQHWPREEDEEEAGTGSGPFMHFNEDYTYFAPKKETDPGIREADTFSLTDTPAAASGWWARQWRKRRRKQIERGKSRALAAADRTGRPASGSGPSGTAGVKNWIPEIIWCLLSLCCLAGIVVVLKLYDGTSLSDWPLRISLNTLIAFLTTFCHACFVVPLVEGLSQLKWNWFARSDRDLDDLQVFDDAGRGLPRGLVRLLVLAKGRLLGMIAAVVVLSGLVTSPLTQSTIKYTTRFVSVVGSGTATIPRIENYVSPSIVLSSDGTLSTPQKQAIHIGLFTPSTVPIPPLAPNTSTPDSTYLFSPFTSLAICSSTTDITSLLSIAASKSGSTATLPNGLSLTTTPDPTLNISSSTSPSLPPTTLSSLSLIYPNSTSPLPFTALSIQLTWCTTTYTASITSGLPVSAQTASTTNLLSNTSSLITLSGPPDDTTNYTISTDLSRALGRYLSTVFTASQTGGGGTEALSLAIASLSGTDTGQGDGQEAVSSIFENVAVSLTNSIRPLGTLQTITPIPLPSPSPTTITISWPHLTLLATQVLLTILFLACVMIQTAVWDVPVLKGSSSSLAALLAVPAEDRAVLERYCGGRRRGWTAAGLTGRFGDGGRGWVLRLGSRGNGDGDGDGRAAVVGG